MFVIKASSELDGNYDIESISIDKTKEEILQAYQNNKGLILIWDGLVHTIDNITDDISEPFISFTFYRLSSNLIVDNDPNTFTGMNLENTLFSIGIPRLEETGDIMFYIARAKCPLGSNTVTYTLIYVSTQ